MIKLFLLFFLLCIISCKDQETGKRESLTGKQEKYTPGPTILFDAFKEQVWSIKNTGFTGYSSLNLFLKKLGYHTAENHKPYREILANHKQDTLFVIGVAMDIQFTQDEITQILTFAGLGGKVLIIAEHDNAYGSSDFLRPLINAGGWELNNNHIAAKEAALPNSQGIWIRTLLPSKKEGPVFLKAGSLTAQRETGCEVLLTSFNGDIVAGVGSYKKGHIAVIADSEFLWNGNPDYKWEGEYPLSFCDPKTREFIKDVIMRLLPVEKKTWKNDFPFSDNPESKNNVYVYGNGGDFYSFSQFFKTLNDAGISVYKYQEVSASIDRAIVISPLETIPQSILHDLSASGKIIIFSDMYTSIKSYADSWELFFKPFKIHPVPHPANDLAEKFGVTFLPYFGVNLTMNEYDNILYIPVLFKGNQLYLHRACAVTLLTGSKRNELYFENTESTFACAAGLGLNHSLKNKHPADLDNPDFLIATNRILAIGDSGIITDDFFHETYNAGVIDMIIQFLAFH
ncbi:MAG: hypothetical protein JXB88_09405 [Spirochaetales bacterium]|nr:hypothetical protein [Spirochaetales bacterium]